MQRLSPCELARDVDVIHEGPEPFATFEGLKEILAEHGMHPGRLGERRFDPGGHKAQQVPQAIECSRFSV